MPSYSSWNGIKCSANKFLLTDLLKKGIGVRRIPPFRLQTRSTQILPRPAKGATAMATTRSARQRTVHYKECIEISINAGMDMVMVTKDIRNSSGLLIELVNEGRIPMARVGRCGHAEILRVKYAQGLLKPGAGLTMDPKVQESFGSDRPPRGGA